MIPLGFQVGTGEPVSIPLGHMVIVGQSQHAGKTTALEAAATRCNRKVIAFLTKRGEGSFRLSREIPPYYEDSVDWRTVRGLCESITEERLDRMQRQAVRAICRAGKFGRGKSLVTWERPKTLADLQIIVAAILDKAGGQRELIYSEIQDDLITVTDEIKKLPKSDTVNLLNGLNVVDLEPFEFQLKSLVVRSFILWVLQHAERTIVVVPEAWKFAPSMRRSPVRDAAEEYIRQGAALGNFLWIDSQNISTVSSSLLSQCTVWLFGVQRLRAEIDKTLDSIPDNLDPRPRASDIATLGKGQFIVCSGREMKHVYVQPAWMSSAHAQAIARNEESVESARQIVEDFDEEHRQ